MSHARAASADAERCYFMFLYCKSSILAFLPMLMRGAYYSHKSPTFFWLLFQLLVAKTHHSHRCQPWTLVIVKKNILWGPPRILMYALIISNVPLAALIWFSSYDERHSFTAFLAFPSKLVSSFYFVISWYFRLYTLFTSRGGILISVLTSLPLTFRWFLLYWWLFIFIMIVCKSMPHFRLFQTIIMMKW